MKTLGDQPAFARSGNNSDFNVPCQEGMSLRAWLAGQALAGLCASTGLYDTRGEGGEPKNAAITHQIAEAAVDLADATLEELAKEGR